MGLFDAPTPTPVELKSSSTTTAPQYLTDYLTNLAQSGQGALGTTADGKFTPYTGDQLIAGLPQNLKDLYSGARTTLNRYQPSMDQALTALQSGATGVTGADISQFYNPYEADVVNRMGELSAQNVQRSMLPALRAAFAGTGGFGSQRYAGALGQAMSDVQTGLLGEQAKLRAQGYKDAVDAALRDRGYDIQAGQALGGLGAQEATAGTQTLKALGDIGTQELGYEQSKIESPLTRAQNVAQIMRGYTYPTSTTGTQEQLPGAFAPSALQQIAGLGTLVGAVNKGSLGEDISKMLGRINWSGSTGDLRSGSNLVTGGGNLGYGEAGSAAVDESNPFPII